MSLIHTICKKGSQTLVFFIAAQPLFSSVAFAAEGQNGDPYRSISSAIAIAIAAFGGALSQGKVATAALDAIGRNPASQGKIFVPMIIALALIESLVLYAFVIAFVKL